eukprot:5125970-Amphidinium_carterae.1
MQLVLAERVVTDRQALKVLESTMHSTLAIGVCLNGVRWKAAAMLMVLAAQIKIENDCQMYGGGLEFGFTVRPYGGWARIPFK